MTPPTLRVVWVEHVQLCTYVHIQFAYMAPPVLYVVWMDHVQLCTCVYFHVHTCVHESQQRIVKQLLDHYILLCSLMYTDMASLYLQYYQIVNSGSLQRLVTITK